MVCWNRAAAIQHAYSTMSMALIVLSNISADVPCVQASVYIRYIKHVYAYRWLLKLSPEYK